MIYDTSSASEPVTTTAKEWRNSIKLRPFFAISKHLYPSFRCFPLLLATHLSDDELRAFHRFQRGMCGQTALRRPIRGRWEQNESTLVRIWGIFLHATGKLGVGAAACGKGHETRIAIPSHPSNRRSEKGAYFIFLPGEFYFSRQESEADFWKVKRRVTAVETLRKRQ